MAIEKAFLNTLRSQLLIEDAWPICSRGILLIPRVAGRHHRQRDAHVAHQHPREHVGLGDLGVGRLRA